MSGLESITRAQRLTYLYNLRSKVTAEIVLIEADINADAALIVREAELEAERPKPLRRRFAECGTDGGYHHHRRIKKEDACRACKLAHSAAERDRAKRAAS